MPEGTVLLGRPFPNPDGTSRILLLVTTNDPVAAFRDLVTRARNAGYDMRAVRGLADGTPATCYLWAVTSSGGGLDYFPIDRPLARGHQLESLNCLAQGRRQASAATSAAQPSPSPGPGPGPEIQYYLPQDYPAENPNVITVDYRPLAAKPSRPQLGPDEIPRAGVPLRMKAPPARFPGTGQRFGKRLVPFGESYVVERGSRLAGPPVAPELASHFGECTAGGLVAWVEVTGDPRAVHDAYVRRLKGLGRSTETSYQAAESSVRQTHREKGLYLETVTAPGQPAYLRIERCQD